MGTTVYGAIGDCLESPVFVLGTSTNKAEFGAFLLKVKGKLKANYVNIKPIILYDQATAHTAHVSQYLLKQQFAPLRIPVYSCEFNCKYL